MRFYLHVSKKSSNFAANFEIMNRITNFISRIFPQRFRVLFNNWFGGLFGGFDVCRNSFASLIWYNICDILGDILEEVNMTAEGLSEDAVYMFAAFKTFVYTWGRAVLQFLWDNGYCVIGWDGQKFWIMTQNEYYTPSDANVTSVKPYNITTQVYVMRSLTYIVHNMSDKAMCKGWLDFLDDVCNGSATITKRLGAVVIASPKNLTNAPTQFVMNKEQKQEMEKELREDYGALGKQSNLLLLPREMNFQTVNLAGMDLKAQEKIKACAMVLADRIKVPANQIAIIDANSSKTLANGSELREGDRAKYASFRRLFERTFVQMANDLGIKFAYTLTGEPVAEQNAQVTQ